MITEEQRIERIEASSKLIGKAVFNSILITLVSFSPILFLTGQEHKLFSPLVWTKTFAMIGSAFVDAAGGLGRQLRFGSVERPDPRNRKGC